MKILRIEHPSNVPGMAYVAAIITVPPKAA